GRGRTGRRRRDREREGAALRLRVVAARPGRLRPRQANEFTAHHFSAAAFSDTRWAFPTAPTTPVTCNRGALILRGSTSTTRRPSLGNPL
ncbi:unnamed protein product, partial [Urochloa humidicola]